MVGRDKLEMAAAFGPDLLLDGARPVKELVHEVRACTDGIGADIVICAVPTAAVQQEALEMVRKRGRIVIYGGVSKTGEMSSLNSNLIHYGKSQ